MGYESRLHFVQHFPSVFASRGLYGVSLIASIELSKAGYGPLGQLIRDSIAVETKRLKDADTPRYFIWDGEEEKTTDPYDDPITPIKLDAVIRALHAELALDEEPPYRRFVLALAIAQELNNTRQWQDIVVLHEGH